MHHFLLNLNQHPSLQLLQQYLPAILNPLHQQDLHPSLGPRPHLTSNKSSVHSRRLACSIGVDPFGLQLRRFILPPLIAHPVSNTHSFRRGGAIQFSFEATNNGGTMSSFLFAYCLKQKFLKENKISQLAKPPLGIATPQYSRIVGCPPSRQMGICGVMPDMHPGVATICLPFQGGRTEGYHHFCTRYCSGIPTRRPKHQVQLCWRRF